MKIGASLPMPGNPSSQTGHRSVAPSRAEGRPDAFAEILRDGRGYACVKPGGCDPFHPTVDTDSARFVVETHIGDTAVRFDARPIVAPIGGPEEAAPQTFTAPKTPDAPREAPTTVTYPALLQLAGEIAARLPAIADRIVQAQAAPVRGESARPRIGGGGVGTWRPTETAMRSPALRHGPTSFEARGSVSAAPQPPSTASQNMVAARIAALPREVMVVLRGLSLTASEERSLSDAMRGMLIQHHLGDRIIRIVGTGAKG